MDAPMKTTKPLSPELRDAFEETRYTVHHQPPFTLRIGQPCPELDALLEASQVNAAAFITACNPMAQPLSRQENENATTNCSPNSGVAAWLAFPASGSTRVMAGRGKKVFWSWAWSRKLRMRCAFNTGNWPAWFIGWQVWLSCCALVWRGTAAVPNDLPAILSGCS